MSDLMSDSTDKSVNGKPPLPPLRPKVNRNESVSVLSPLIDEMIPPRPQDINEMRLRDGSLSRHLTPRPGGFIKKLVAAEDEDKHCRCDHLDETMIKEPTPYFGPPSYPVNGENDNNIT